VRKNPHEMFFCSACALAGIAGIAGPHIAGAALPVMTAHSLRHVARTHILSEPAICRNQKLELGGGAGVQQLAGKDGGTMR
jgi:hypothetical protein